MTVDLHPDDLLDQERGGALAGRDAERLADHLAVCRACALERLATADYRTQRAQPHGNAAAVDRIVARAMAEVAPDSLAARARRLSFARAAAGIAVIAGLAGGAAAFALRSRVAGRAAASRPELVVDRERQVTPSPVQNASAPVPGGEGTAGASLRHANPPRRVARDEPAVTATGDTAEDLFAHANAARRVGHYDDAIGLYRTLARAFPGSKQEILARVTLGRLFLDRGEAGAALDLFGSYLLARPNGPVAEEALVGRAEALRRLDRTVEEREAWERLVATYPDSTHTERARRRIEALR